MKFLHTSDWHLGRQLHNFSLIDDQQYVLQQIIDLAVEHRVDAVVVAGDIYDRSIPPANAVKLLDDVIHELIEVHHIPVIMIAGNHDGHERLGFASRQLKQSGLHIVGPLVANISAITIKGKHTDAVFYGVPYADPATVRDVFDCDARTHEEAMAVLLEQVIQSDAKGLPKVVVSHCFIAGGESSDSERPLSIGGADHVSAELFKPFNYVALGHLHGPQFKGYPHIRYSGSILKYSFSEQHQNKSVTLVTLDQKGIATTELLPLHAQRDVRIIEGLLSDLLEVGVSDTHRDDYLMVRLLDKTAILDAMGKLRSVYPNVMHVERTGLLAQTDTLELNRDHLAKSEFAMFRDFFEQVNGESLSPQQTELLQQTIEEIHHAEDRS
ncbi:exonuclease SbcCD subunit D [Echinimonas agarilytica]|uniref:Nuclease SbcCD subunit D n=1 Tax=Echinimonas agarilytica TaxID=1215918 RepID=A0AA41W8V0_9GAMM|nr:exonuclease SbcCD subunit D [Echinimonas agarilytica]MCM2681245.1 exonuclease SbcCD subunit D [Echinimonas agarilytica]